MNHAFASVIMEKGVVGTIKGGGPEELLSYTFTTPYLTSIVIENKVSDFIFVILIIYTNLILYIRMYYQFSLSC